MDEHQTSQSNSSDADIHASDELSNVSSFYPYLATNISWSSSDDAQLIDFNCWLIYERKMHE